MNRFKFERQVFAHRSAGLALITASLFVAVTAFYPQFATLANVRDSFDDTTILILLALGEMFVILTGAIDLSVAANVAFTGLCVALMNHAAPGIPLSVVVAAALGIGAFLGLLNGVLVWHLSIPPIV